MLERTIRNQEGEEIVEYRVRFENGRWYEEELNCYSSADLGLGTCECNSHDTYKERRLSRREVAELLKEKGIEISSLSETEREDLAKAGVFREDVEEKIELAGLTWDELEDWLLASYKLGMNPLPALRKFFNAEVRFAYWNPRIYFGDASVWVNAEKPFLVCVLKTEDKNPVEVELEIVDPDDEERRESCV